MVRLLQASGVGMTLTVVLFTSGCVTTDLPLFHVTAKEEPRPCRILSYWDRNVRVALDTKSQQAFRPNELPVLAGRVYFLSADPEALITPRGWLSVAFYDYTTPTDTPRMLGCTQDDPGSMQKMRKRDLLGEGYTIVALWDYDPRVTRVKIQMTFVPEKGGDPLYAEPAIVTLLNSTVEKSQRIDIPALNAPRPIPSGSEPFRFGAPPTSVPPMPTVPPR